MKMKQLLTYTSTLLRTALLLGALAFLNIQTQAQTAEQLAAMPNAFETVAPNVDNDNSIIGNGEYYYIQFYYNGRISYLTDRGLNKRAWVSDFLPSNNRLWTLESAGVNNSGEILFKLKSKTGNYIGYEYQWDGSSGWRYVSLGSGDNAATFKIQESEDGYNIFDEVHKYYDKNGNPFEGLLGRFNNTEWSDLPIIRNDTNGKQNSRMHFVKLKDNAAFIIYYREEGTDNADPNANTTRHYLTYSNTDAASSHSEWNFRESTVSSRQSIIPNNKSLSTLPTAATYHKDGLWTLEETGTEGQFYIKKYGNGTNDYLNAVQRSGDWFYLSDLGTKDGTYGKYILEDENANRYTRIQNVEYQINGLAATMFYDYSNDNVTQVDINNFTFHVGDNVAITNGDAFVGPNNWQVNYQIYADLTSYTKMIIEGTPYMQVRVLMNRQTGSDPFDGAERLVTIGSNGKGELDLTEFSYIHLNSIKRLDANNNPTGTISAIRLERPIYLHHAEGDGWQVLQWGESNPDYWYAGFYPVEVPDPNQDDFYRVLLGIKREPRTDSRIKLTRETGQGSVSVVPLAGSTETDLYGATFTVTSNGPTNVFQIKNLEKGCYEGIVIEFNSPIPAGFCIHTYGDQGNYKSLQAGIEQYVIDLSDGDQTIDDFTIFTLSKPENPTISIKACYFTPSTNEGGEPDCGIISMLNYSGGKSNYSEALGERILWELEQVDDYQHFRLKTPNGRYYKGEGQMTNFESQAAVFTNETLMEKFDLKWFLVNIQKEILATDRMVTHRKSYLQQYAQEGLDKQGLATNVDSDWWNYGKNDSDPRKSTQKVNHFEITHYVKQGTDNSIVVEFPTVLNMNNDHVYYQRFYNYDEADNSMDLNKLKAHVSMDTGDGNSQYILYKNGMVTGQKLDWSKIDLGDWNRNVQRRFKFTNSDGQAFTVAIDVSRYSDLTYYNQKDEAGKPIALQNVDPTTCKLEEPSLTMRYIYYMKDAKVMAADLTGYPEQTGVVNPSTWRETGTVCIDESKWMEKKVIHFPAKPLSYENEKWVGYRGEFIGLRHVFSDYWVFNSQGTGNDNLVSAVNPDNKGGKIEVRIFDPNNTGIRLGGWNPVLSAIQVNDNEKNGLRQKNNEGNDDDYQGFYFYDKMYNKTSYGDSRFIVFRYPKDNNGNLTGVTATDKPVYIHVYFNNGGTRYQLAQYTLIFDKGAETLPWKSVNGAVNVSGQDPVYVQGTYRDPNKLREVAGEPIAKVTFDYPQNTMYHFPNTSETKHDRGTYSGGSIISDSSPIPLAFDNTNYAFDGKGCNWGSYAMVSDMSTTYGNQKAASPANAATSGYGIGPDKGLQSGFLYIDASEQPGDICSADFQGEFCERDKLMCSGWISGSNKVGGSDYRCAGGITLTVKGERIEDGEKEAIYRFCPGQCYELDNGTANVDGSDGNQVVWQQFYFEFGTTKKYRRYWMEVNNNCVSSNGGDFMLDNVEVFAFVPEATPEMNTPICINKDASEMQLLKISVGFDKLLSAIGDTEVTGSNNGEDRTYSFVFLEKDVFLTTFKNELYARNNINKTIAELEAIIQSGEYGDKVTNVYADAYKAAFKAAVLGDYTHIWDSNSPDNNRNAAVLNFHWSTKFSEMPTYSFADAVNKRSVVFGETNTKSGERLIVMNGNYPNQLQWKVNTDYYIVPYNSGVTDLDALYEDFNICSICNKKKVFQIKPPLNILSMETSDITQELEVCEGKIPTLLTNLKGFSINGEEVPLKNLNFDWWLGDLSSTPKVLATLENYHSQTNDAGTVRLDESLAYFRAYYPGVTSLEGITQRVSQTPFLTLEMISYLQDLVDKGQLVLHQKSISIPAKKASDDDPYFYLVACPIHDGYFDQALNNGSTDVAYLCDEPQGLRMKVSEKAPSLKCGFVPNENGFSTYSYPDGNPVLSIRLAKKAQFETVQHGTTAEAPKEWETNSDLNFLWLPIRDAKVQSTGSAKVIRMADDYNIYLASTDDPTWDKAIYTAMSAVNDKNEPIGSLPIVGKIVKLNAIDTGKVSSTAEKDANRLCIYFTEDFEVREGYNYTLSLPFREDGNENTCDGTLLIHLKIVPDYEVWTGGAGTTDWNNDQNWRRADGNRGTSTEEPKDGAGRNNNELLVSANLPSTSGLYNYTTNFTNYRTAKDRLLRKGYAPLYCTHILIKSNEWGDDPVLYDALAGKNNLDAAPFPNLSESYEEETIEYVDERYESIEALNGKTFAIYNETEHRLIYGTTFQNLGYDIYDEGVKDANAGYYFKLESVEGGYYLLHLQKPEGGDYVFDAWGGTNHPGYLNSQPLSGTVSFVLGLTGTSNQYTYGQDGNNLALWDLQTDAAHPGKFALKNVGTGKYLKDNTNARYNNPTFFTFCTLKKETVTTTKVKDNILKYDMQARVYDIWNETYGSNPDKGRTGDLIAEMYQINSCDEIAFQPTAEMLNAHLLNYNNAWVEYELDNKRWYLLGSSLQGTISGEWYAPTGTAQQKTTYYEPVTFGEGYDRYSPAIYQRSWDKAKAVLYEVGATYATTDDSQTENLGNDQEGIWSSGNWPTTSGDADEYLDRLGYKPFADKKANVAIKGVWSNTYNDATVDYSKGAFSVMVMNHLKNNDQSSGKSLIRLPKEDTMYDYYRFSENGSNDGGTDTYLSDPANQDKDDVQTNLNRAKNRGRLKSDMLLPASNTSLPTYQQIQRTEKTASRYGDQRTYTRVPTQKGENGLPLTLRSVQETVSPGISNLGFFLVENPFQCGLSMDEFFSVNNQLETKYWLLTPSGQQLVQQVAEDMWITPNGTKFALAKAKVAPGQGFFVQAKTGTTDANNIKFTSAMQVQTRYGKKSNEGTTFNVVVGTKKVLKDDDGDPDTPEVEVIEDITEDIVIYSYVQDTGDGKEFPLKARTRGDEASSKIGLVITAQRGNDESNALVMVRDVASADFLPSEDTETFISTEDLKNVPTVYTLCGRLATTINSIHDFTCLPLDVESSSETACVLTFNGVEQLGDSVGFYDAVERKLTPLKSGMKFTVSGQTQHRYYLVSSLKEEKVAEETHLQIFTEGLTAKVIASTAEPITSVRCFDMSGRLIHTATPQTCEYSFSLPKADIYIIEAQTEKDRKTKKVMVK